MDVKYPGFLVAVPLSEILELRAKKCPEDIALIKKEVFTYEKMEKAVKSIAFYLQKKDIKKGDRIGILAENAPEWILCFFAIQYVGGICVPLDTRLGYLELKGIVEHSGMKALFLQRRFFGTIEKVIRERAIDVIFTDEEDDLDSIKNIMKKDAGEVDREKTTLEDPAVLFYTSGTTGVQKGVLLTHKNIVSNIISLLKAVHVDEKDRFFSILPLSHAYELVAGNLLPLYAGASVAYASSLKPREMIEDMIASKPTIVLTVPLVLEKLLKGIERRIGNLPHLKRWIFDLSLRIPGLKELPKRGIKKSMGLERLRFFVSGGAHLSERVELGLGKLGFKVIQGYGLTEASPVVSLNPPHRPKSGSCGIALPNVEIGIVNVGRDGVGEIVVRGDNVMKGYYQNEEANKEAFLSDGSLLTGDLGYIDGEGYLYITGRKKSVIVTRGGLTIYPEEIENTLSQSPYIKEVVVIKKQKDHSEELHAIVFPDEEALSQKIGNLSSPDEKRKVINEIIQRQIRTVSENLADYKRVRSFSLRDEEFPKTATNKIKRYLFE